MVDFDVWVKSQLKRGFTKNHIKKHLIKKGYPSTVVAKVDRVRSHSKNIFVGKKVFIKISLFIILIWIVFDLTIFNKNIISKETVIESPEITGPTGDLSELYGIQPVGNTLIDEGEEALIFNGTITQLDSQSITLFNDGKTATFPISSNNPPTYLNITAPSPFTPDAFKEEVDNVKVGDKVVALILATPSNDVTYVDTLVIDNLNYVYYSTT